MTELERARSRQEQQNDLVAGQAAELARLRRRHEAGVKKLAALHASELALAIERHRHELALLWQAQGRDLGPGMERHLAKGGHDVS